MGIIWQMAITGNDYRLANGGSPRQDDICIDRDRLPRTEDSQLGRNSSLPKGPARGSLGAMIGQFKSRATKRIWSLPGYDHITVWQRNYYEHIIRNQAAYDQIRADIQANPLRWTDDQLHPAAPPNPYNQGRD